MLNRFALECVICSIVVIYCGGKPLGNTAPKTPNDSVTTNLMDSKNNASPQTQVLHNLFGLLNKTVVQALVMDHNNITRGSLSTDKLQQLLFLAKPANNNQSTSTALENRFQEISSSSLQPPKVSTQSPVNTSLSSQIPSTLSPLGPSLSGQFSNGRPGELTLPGNPAFVNPWRNQTLLQNRGQENITNTKPLDSQNSQLSENRFPVNLPSSSVQLIPSSKPPLEYIPHRPFFAGQTDGGRPGQLIPAGEPLPNGNVQQIPQNRFPEISTISAITTNKSPSEYNPQRPFFAGQTAGGRPEQLIPAGEPLPDGNVQQIPQNRFPEISTISAITTNESLLEYNPQRPFFAGQTAGGRPGQLIPSGEPLPAENVQQNTLSNNSSQQSLEDRVQAPSAPTSSQSETNLPATATPISTSSTTTFLPLTTSTKSPLEYNNQRPSFASQVSSGKPGQLIPPGEPWPANPPTVQNRFPDIVPQFESDGQRPFFSGQFSNGRPGQLIPQGHPWPADTSSTKSLVQDRFLGYTSSLQHRPGSDSLERQFTNGGPDRLIPPRGSWSTNPLEAFDYTYF
ncbi:mucin-2-like [Euwallacea fornicatus]|uniref:mucin-2-like n=1 Tax=Euwallacea fornicatus TaxID=995702 RepID=UPI00338E26E9